ncbi:MAG: hypothetical protein Q4C70_08395 [Planctomycetia bacterium]|nr:hypothetical protein [Planctomycetia bacterium]
MRFTLRQVFIFCLAVLPGIMSASAEERIQVGHGIQSVWKPGVWIPFQVKIGYENETRNPAINPEEKPSGKLGEKLGEKPEEKPTSERFRGRVVLEIPDSDGIPMTVKKEVNAELPTTVELCGRIGNAHGNYRIKVYKSSENKRESTAKTVTGVVTVARTDSEMVTEAEADSKMKTESLIYETVQSVEGALRNTKGVILVVGPTEAGVEASIAQMACASELKPTVVRVESAGDLPESVTAWELVDTLVLTTENEPVLESWGTEEIKRLKQWTERGGTLVVSVGKNAEKWASDSRWEWLLPGKLEKVIPVRETAAMEVFAQSPIPVTLLGVSEKYRIGTARFTELLPSVQVRAQQYDLPLVLRRGMGLGQVHWVTFDLEHPAISQWEGRGNFLAMLLGFSEKNVQYAQYEEKSVRGMVRGYDDISGQLRSALDDFSGLRPVSFGLLAGFFFVYLAIIGPGCWFLCRKLPHGGEIASWILFLVTVGTGTVFLLFLFATDGELRVNQVQVTDYLPENNTLRQSCWGNVWSPDAETWTIAWETTCPVSSETGREETVGKSSQSDASCATPPKDGWVSWFGLPGAYLGGMDSRMTFTGGDFTGTGTHSVSGYSGNLKGLELSGNPELSGVSSASEMYTLNGCRLENVPFLARSTRSFCACRWEESVKNMDFGTLSEYNQSRVLGEIRNPLSVALDGCLLLYGGWAYEIGRLEPGECFTIHEGVSYFSASALLLDADMIEDRSLKSSVSRRRVNRPYDPVSHNLTYILRTMMFFEKCGGRTYTGLSGQYQRQLDVSALLNCRTAVLYGVPEMVNSGSDGNARASGNTEIDGLFGRLTILNPKDGKVIPCENSEDKNVRVLRVFLPVETGK